jgi:hypothetical protein
MRGVVFAADTARAVHQDSGFLRVSRLGKLLGVGWEISGSFASGPLSPLKMANIPFIVVAHIENERLFGALLKFFSPLGGGEVGAALGEVCRAAKGHKVLTDLHCCFWEGVLWPLVAFKRDFLKSGVGVHPGDIFFGMLWGGAHLPIDSLFGDVDPRADIAGAEELVVPYYLFLRILDRGNRVKSEDRFCHDLARMSAV